MNTFMQSITRASLILVLVLAPTLALAATTIVGGSSGNAGYIGVSGGGSSFGFSWGGAGGGMGGIAACNNSICGVAQTIVYIINAILVPLLFAVAFIMFLYGVASKYIFSHGDPGKAEEGHKLILWGLIGFVVMISLWGLVNVVSATFGLQGYTAPPTPTSY